MTRKTAQIELGGKLRTMNLDLNALCGLNEQGQDLDSLRSTLAEGKTSLSTMRLMIWAFLVSDSEDKGEQHTPKSIGGMIDGDNLEYCMGKLVEFITGQPKDKKQEEPTAENPTEEMVQ